jgi:class 3 adenylate cyclase/tetratricopeptide (TPR) repeat protein
MRCPSCGFDNPEGLKFCGDCGTPVTTPCPRCGFANPPGFKFCGDCGVALGPAPRISSPPRLAAQPQPPSRYTPAYLAEKILTSKSALEGERKQVTVLFADLKGSMELLSDRDPEDARQLLDPVLMLMMDAVHRYEGTVNQVMGDGIMVLFGAPIAHEDHAVRACYAALAMQGSVKQYAAEVQRTKGVPIQIRVGLNAGEVMVRSIGSDLHMDYTAVGQTTHLAARMQQMAIPGSILITPQVLGVAEGYVQVTALGPVPVKGLSTPVDVYEVLGAGPVRTRLQAAAVRGLTRFVGRDREVAQLHQALQWAGTGHGQVVALVGEPGVGKSRLVYEFLHSPRTQGWLVLESRSVSYGKPTPDLPVIDLLEGYCGIDARDDPRRMREKVLGKVLGLDEALRSILPPILALLDVPVDDAGWQRLDPPQRRQRTLEAVKRLLLRESQVQPLLLVFEDLHWIDAETQALLDSLVESLGTAQLLLLVNYRPEYQHGWGRKTYYTQLRLDPLPPASTAAILQALLGDDSSLTPLTPLLIARTAGNPFFLEEGVRTLVETGALVGETGAYRLAQPLQSIQVPATVQAVLAARIDRLPPDAKRLLQTAAVIGTEVPFSLLAAIADLPDTELHRHLTQLQAAEFLYETRLFPEHEYTFKHALTHEVAYSSLLQERRRALHVRIVEALEALAGDRLADQVERLAHHALRGEVWDKALRYLRQAGAKAVAHAANREAVTYLERAMVALQQFPTTRDTCEQAIELWLELRYALLMLGELGRVLQCLRDAETLAETLNDGYWLGRIAIYMAHHRWLTGDYDQAMASGHRALAIAHGDVGLEVRANLALGYAYHALGEYRRALVYFRQHLESLEGGQIRAYGHLAGHLAGGARQFRSSGLLHLSIRPWLVWCLAELGAFAEGLARGEAGVRVAEASGDLDDQVAALYGIGLLHHRQGHLLKAIPVLEQGLGLCHGRDLPIWFSALASELGHAYTLSGRIPEALPLLERSIALDTSMGVMVGHALSITWLSEGYLRAGRMHEAKALAARALELSRTYKERGNEAYALQLHGEIAADHDPPEVEQAEDGCRQALALAERLGMRPLQAHCHHSLGTLYAKIGEREQARAELSTAIELYRSRDMTFWLPEAEAALAQVEGR